MTETGYMETIKRRHRRTKYYCIFMLLNFFFGVLSFALPLYWLAGYSIVMSGMFFIWAMEGLVLLVFLLCRREILRDGGDSTFVEPYFVRLTTSEPDTIQACFDKLAATHPIDELCSYGYFPGRRNVRLFFMRFPQYSKEQYKRTTQKIVRHAKKKYGMRTMISMAEAHKALRINFIILDELNEEVEKKLKTNASYGLSYAEGVLYVYFDASQRVLYIPAYCGTMCGASYLHLYGVRFLRKVLKDIISDG